MNDIDIISLNVSQVAYFFNYIKNYKYQAPFTFCIVPVTLLANGLQR